MVMVVGIRLLQVWWAERYDRAHAMPIKLIVVHASLLSVSKAGYML